MARKAREEEPWERQPGESAQAFEAFVLYRDMGPDRSITKVVQKLNKSRPLIGRWSSQWNWPERVRAYDIDLDREAKAKAVTGRKKMIERHIGIADLMQKKAVEALEKLDPEEMTMKEIREYIKTATELERLSRALDADRHDADESDSEITEDTVIYLPENGRDDDE